MHTPSAPQVQEPIKASDPRYSTSGILNAQLKEKNRQGLLSTYGGRNGQAVDINRFADQKNNMRDSSSIRVLEEAARLFQSARNNAGDASRAGEYNANVDALNKLYASYGEKNNLQKANVHTETKFWSSGGISGGVGPGLGYPVAKGGYKTTSTVTNKDAINNMLSKLGTSGEEFNKLQEKVKKKNNG